MKDNNKIDLGLTGYDALFMSGEESTDIRKPKVEEIALSELTPFKDHPFRVKNDDEMAHLIRSIADCGVLVPALARPKGDGGFELISGHRRLVACKELGMNTMPVIIRNLTDEEAIITMVDSNLQREHILPSEKAFAYKMKVEALSHQGRTSVQLGQKSSRGLVAENVGASETQIQRYIRLTNLEKPLLDLVDEGRIALTPAVELSYLQADEQRAVAEAYERDEATPSYAQAVRLRKLSEQGLLTEEKVGEIMSEVKGNQKEYLKLPSEKCDRYLSRFQTAQQKEDFVLKALEYYSKYLERQRGRDAR